MQGESHSVPDDPRATMAGGELPELGPLDEQGRPGLEAAAGIALVGVLESANNTLDAVMQQPCLAAIIAGSVAVNFAVANSPVMRRAWLHATPDLAGALRVFSLFALSLWLCSSEGARTLRASKTDRSAWARSLLAVFGDNSPAALQRFDARDLQLQYEMQKRGEADFDTIALVTTNLLWSDASQALGGKPLAEGIPDEGYPFESTNGLLAASGPVNTVPNAVEVNVMASVRSTIARLVTGDTGAPGKRARRTDGRTRRSTA